MEATKASWKVEFAFLVKEPLASDVEYGTKLSLYTTSIGTDHHSPDCLIYDGGTCV